MQPDIVDYIFHLVYSASHSGVSVGDLSEQCDFSALTCVAPQCWIVCAHSVLVHAECISCPSVH